MHPSMKNFYELLDIKKQIDIFLKLSPADITHTPDTKIIINEIVYFNSKLLKQESFTHSVELLKNIDIKIELSNKNYKITSSTAIIIESLKIDEFELIPKWTQLATYNNDQSISQPTNYLGFNGIWNLKINEPFYRWKHRVTGQGWLLEP